MAKRSFRTPESYEAERITQALVAEYLRARGFENIVDKWERNGQTITATTPSGGILVMRVRQCWRRGEGDTRGYRPYAAAQLLAEVTNDDWEGSLRAKVERDRASGLSHLLFVQREGEEIVLAALVPLDALVPIWEAERAVYQQLIAAGQLGKRRANPVENGRSPTLYLEDDLTPEVTTPLWSHPDVIDVGGLPLASAGGGGQVMAREGRSAAQGAGFGDATANRLVEEAAVRAVRERYESEGWEVRSVEQARCGFDLFCRRGQEAEHVEVKGISGERPAFTITRGEVEQARRDPAWRLVVVTGCGGDHPQLCAYTGQQFLAAFSLDPVQYRANPIS